MPARRHAVARLADDGLPRRPGAGDRDFVALRLPQPLLLEGEAGVGKTEAAKALAAVLDTPLIRLQCYEGIDAAEALYEWNYPRSCSASGWPTQAGSTLHEEELFGSGLPDPAAAAAVRSSIPDRDLRCC